MQISHARPGFGVLVLIACTAAGLSALASASGSLPTPDDSLPHVLCDGGDDGDDRAEDATDFGGDPGHDDAEMDDDSAEEDDETDDDLAQEDDESDVDLAEEDDDIDEDSNSEDDDSDDEWSTLDNALKVLWGHDSMAKRRLASTPYFLEPLFRCSNEEDARRRGDVLISLRSLLRSEPDDFVASQILKSLGARADDTADPLFIDALKSSSPNMRWVAYAWFSEHENRNVLSELENAWRTEERPWAKADLIQALARNGSSRHFRDMVRLANASDVDLTPAAMRALTTVGDDAAVAPLARIAAEARLRDRLAALEALTAWPASYDALEAVKAATLDHDRAVRAAAAAALGSFGTESATERILELALDDDQIPVRVAALSVLCGKLDPGIVPASIGILHETPTRDLEPLFTLALIALKNLDDRSALTGLGDLDPALGSWVTVGDVVASLSRNGSEPLESIRICGGGTRYRSPANNPMSADRVMRVITRSHTRSIRCWASPDEAGDPEQNPRIPSGAKVWIVDHYEQRDEPWVQTVGDASNGCWVRLESLEPGAGRSSTVAEPRGTGDEPIQGDTDNAQDRASASDGSIDASSDIVSEGPADPGAGGVDGDATRSSASSDSDDSGDARDPGDSGEEATPDGELESSNIWPGRLTRTASHIRIEFDASSAEMVSERARQLTGAGLLEEIEPGPEVVGLALSIDAKNEKEMSVLGPLTGSGKGILDRMVRVAHDRAEAFLRAAARKAAAAAGAATAAPAKPTGSAPEESKPAGQVAGPPD